MLLYNKYHALDNIFMFNGSEWKLDASIEWQNNGAYSEVWDSCNYKGTPLSSGVYFTRLNAGGKTATGRMLLIK